MTWRSTLFTIALCLTGWGLLAQSGSDRKQPDRRFMAELSSIFLDYQGLQTGDLTQVGTFAPGITMGAHANLSPRFDLSSGMSFVPELRYPIQADREVITSLIDVNALARFKFRRPDALIAPFLGLGFGLNSASNNVRLYLPVSAGLKLQLQENFAIMLQSTYKQGFGANNIQHLAHTVGFVFGIPGTEIIEPRKPASGEDEAQSGSMPVAEIADADGDGVPDRDDLCVDKPGRAMYLGCPIDDTPASTLPVEPEQAAPTIAVTDQPVQAPTAPQAEPQSEIQPAPQVSLAPAPEETYTQGFTRISSQDIEIVRRAMDAIYFEPGSDRLTEKSKEVLDRVAVVLRRNPAYHLAVQGYSDAVSDPDPNRILPVTRAFAVKRYLCYDQDIKYARVYSDGKANRDNRLNEFTSRPKDRRVELDLIAPDHQAYRGE